MLVTLKQMDLNQNVKERDISWYIPQMRTDSRATSLHPQCRRNEPASVVMELTFCF